MSSFAPAFLRRFRADAQELRSLQLLAQCRGRQGLHLALNAPVVESLRCSALVESTESSNRLEGIVTTHARVRDLVTQKLKAKGRDEAQIAGYRDALALIHDPKTRPEPSLGALLHLHRLASRGEPEAGILKHRDNVIAQRGPDGVLRLRFKPVSARRTPAAVDQWVLHHHLAEQEGLDPVLAMGLLILDLTCIHPFRDGNGRVSRLWTLLLAYEQGMEVGRYVSLERLIEQNRERYYDNLAASSQGWHEHKHDPHPWLHYFIFHLLAAYQEFEAKVQSLRAKRGDKSILLTNTILSQRGPFSLRRVQEQCEGVSFEAVKAVLKKLRAEKRVRLISRGRDAKYLVVQMDDPSSPPKKSSRNR